MEIEKIELVLQQLKDNQQDCKRIIKERGWAKFDKLDALIAKHHALAAKAGVLIAKAKNL